MKKREFRAETLPSFSVRMDNSMCRDGHKVSEKLAQKSIERAPRLFYSPNISMCNFWLFDMPKHSMKDREFQSQQAVLRTSAKSWVDLTFADGQRVFQEWMERRTWVVGNNEEYYPNERHQFRKWFPVQ
jgi:hypothetical protein